MADVTAQLIAELTDLRARAARGVTPTWQERMSEAADLYVEALFARERDVRMSLHRPGTIA